MFRFTTPTAPANAATTANSTASASALAPPPAGFALGASPAAATAPVAPGTAAPPVPGFGNTTANASVKPSDAPAAPTAVVEPPAPSSYTKLFEKAFRDGTVSDAFAQEIRRRFAAPMEMRLLPSNGAAAVAPTLANAAQQVGTPWKSGLTPPTSLAGSGPAAGSGTAGAAASAPSTSTLARNTAAQQQQQQRQSQVENAQSFLQLLLMCDSGYNNSEAPPAGNAASPQWTETGEEAVKGLHAAIGSIAASAASNLIAFVKSSVVKHTQALDGESTSAASIFGDNRRKRPNDDPTLLAAQCLYLLSRHFQLAASVVKEALDLVDAFYYLLKNSLRSRVVALPVFSENSDTCVLNTLTWLCVFSVVNMVAVWKKLRSSSGDLRLNELIQSSAAASIEATVTTLRKRLRESVQSTTAAPNVGGLHGGGAAGELRGGAARASAASLMPPAVYTWQVILDSYVSILTLAEGCLLRAKGSEEGFDKALDAFLGERASAAVSSASASHAAAVSASVAVHRGKVTKRMVELAPVPRTLVVPVELLYIAPYEMMSYLFDEMLPLLRHLSELEVETHRRYIEQLEELPRISAAVRGGGGGPTGGFQPRPGAASLHSGGDGGDDGWLRRMTHVGMHGEVVGESFTSEMAHLLEALAICLQHLPPEVLNPDLDADCAATFFIFQNFVKHMRQVFATQRSGGGGAASDTAAIAVAGATSAVWENYTLKLMTKFLEVLAMIGRNPQYTQRVVMLLTDAQVECGELQWHSLVCQALECAGFNSGALNVPGMGGSGSGVSLPAVAAAAAAASSSGLQSGRGAEAEEAYAASSTVVVGGGVSRTLHRQFTRAYARKCQRQFVASFFLLLRQVFAHPTLRPTISAYLNLELALTFLFAPQQSQVMLGSTLSLISALITTASDAQLVWTFLEQRHLLQLPSMRTQRGNNGGGSGGTLDGTAALYDRFIAASREPTSHEETLSLIGHCQYESTQGTYDITIGFLNLITTLFQNGQPSLAALGVYTTVTSFISQEIMRGVLKRVFTFQHERYTVFSLAAAALRQALLVRFHGENGRTATLPFANVMAINKAPADVVGEVVKLIFEASDAPYELLSHHRAAVRQALRLLITAVQTVQEQKIDLLLFDTRTTLNTDLAVRVLRLCSLQDTILTKTTLQLLLLFPFETASQAAQYWSGLAAKYAPVLESFAQLLHPLSMVPAVVQAPPELAQLDFDPAELMPGWTSALLTDTKSLLLDLLMRHADVTEPSLTAWMCGFYHEGYAVHNHRGRVDATGSGSLTAEGYEDDSGEPSWWHTTLLKSVVEGACSDEVERVHPTLAVKCVKLLYLLRANRLYGALVVRPFLESVCRILFLRLQHFRACQCAPVALSKYAYVLKLLALEACYTYRTSPGDLRLAQSTSIPPISVEVLLSLLYPFGAASTESGQVRYDGFEASAPGAALGSSRFAAGIFRDGGDSHTDDDDNNSSSNDKHGEHVAESHGTSSPAQTVTVVARDAAVDITGWLPQALQVLPTFPEKLPPISGGRSHLVPCAADGVVQYNVASLYEALQLEQVRANKPPLTMAELRDKLRPFIAANDCFFSYAAGVSFVEGWCQLVSVSCSVVQGLSMSRLRAFALCILRGLDATTSMTAAAQEQVCARLCHCLSTVMAHLRKATLVAAGRLSLAASHTAEAPWSRMNHDGDLGDRQSPVTSGNVLHGAAGGLVRHESGRGAAARSQIHGAASGDLGEERRSMQLASGMTHRFGKRRPREESADRRVSGNLSSYKSQNNLFATQVGDASNFYSAAGRTQLAQATLQQRQGERAAMAADSVSANTAILQPLVHALVQWGTRIATIRADLYISLLCLAETPGINLDDVVLWRSQKALLSVICADICSGCAATTTPAVAVMSGAAIAAGVVGGVGGSGTGAPGMAPHSSAGEGVSGGGGSSDGAAVVSANAAGGALGPQVQHAVALLVALLQTSAPIRDDFCNPTAGSGDGLGMRALRCATALLQSVDNAVCGFFASSGVPIGSLLWHLRSAFDVLSVVSLGHASQMLHSDLLRLCFAMQAWRHSTQVVLGYSQTAFTHEPMMSKPLVEQNKEVLRQLLLGVVRWVNLLLSSLGDATPLLYEVQKFIRDNRSLVDYVFISPAAVSSALPGSARLSGSHLILCAELSECLRALSSSVLAVDCRTLVDSMALPDLLNMLSSETVWRRGPSDLYDLADMEGVNAARGGVGVVTEAGAVTSVAAAAAEAASTVATTRYGAAPAAAGIAPSTGGAELMESVGGTAATTSAAEHARDIVALTVRNLSHLLLNAEYGLRGTEAESFLGDGGVSATPMLRFSASKRNLCLQIVRHVAHSLAEMAQVRTREFRLECHLYALHALVCLLHSFVLPLAQGAPPPQPQQQQTADDFLRYLKDLPLQELVEVLTQAHDAVYRLRRLNTDYRGGVRVHRLDARHPWAAGVDGGEAADGDDAAAQPLSNGMRPMTTATADGGIPHSTPKSTPVVHSTEAFSVPSTPGLLPAASARRSGWDSRVVQGPPQGSPGLAKASGPCEGLHHRHGVPSTAAAASHERDPNSTVVQRVASAPARGAEVGNGLSAVVPSMLPNTTDGEKLRPDSTLWELLPSRYADGETWTRVYDSFQNNGAPQHSVNLAESRGTSRRWAEVLNVENEVRQIKVAIANALRATKGAMAEVRKLQ